MYDECLTLDPLYNEFNMTIYYNKACALAKVNQNDDALQTLNQAIDINKQYVKAYFKRGDILLSLNRFDEAIAEYNRVKELNPQTPGLREKLKHAQLELKKSKRKDYYAILEVSKDATETEIKKAYRRKAVEWHPDKHQQNGEAALKEAEIRFKDIGEGYSVLSDEKKRKMYDEGYDLEEINQGGGSNFGGMDANTVFQTFFSSRGGGGHHFHF